MSELDRPLTRGFLYTDQYQLTMAQLYRREGLHERPVQFDFFFRDYPDYGGHQAGYCICAGLEPLLQWMEETRMTPDDAECLRNDRDANGQRVFDDEFVDWLLAEGCFDALNVYAVPEGRVIHPHTPVISVQGPLAMAQIFETPLINQIGYAILAATKASRIRLAGQKRPLLEFGLRRAQSWAAHTGARAALIGGADFTSNVAASHALGFPPKGTHAHSMVQLYLGLGRGEIDAFRAYARLYPDNCILLIDTVDTLHSGLPNAIRVFRELREAGHEPRGVRLDSGDLAYLSIQTAKQLDDAGFDQASIVLSGDLNEMALWQIIQQVREDAPGEGIDPEALIGRFMYGVGTELITSRGAPALKAAYKLVAVHHEGAWQPTVKISESSRKTPTPGTKVLWRIYDSRGKAAADVVAAPGEDLRSASELRLHHPTDPYRHRTLSRDNISDVEQIQQGVYVDGTRAVPPRSIDDAREARDADLARLDAGVRRLINPHVYHVSLTEKKWQEKSRLIEEMTGDVPGDAAERSSWY